MFREYDAAAMRFAGPAAQAADCKGRASPFRRIAAIRALCTLFFAIGTLRCAGAPDGLGARRHGHWKNLS